MRPACLLSALLLATTATTAADARRPIREARSDNGAFYLRIDPGRPGRPAGRCEATLEGRGKEGGGRRWSRPLVNEVGPMQAFVRNDGRYVVTLDEAGYGGARHAVVIYGPQGELLRHFLLTDLLDRSDWRHIQVRGREVVWLRGARCAFDSPADHFEIELRWGRTIRIDLRTLAVVAEGRAAVAGDDVPPAVAEALFALDAADEPGEAGVASRPAGSELGTLTPEEEARARAVQAELAGDAPPVGREPDDVGTELRGNEAGVEKAEPPHVEGETPVDAGRPEPAPETSAAEPTPAVANPEAAELTGIAVPMPDPAAKTDYVGWLNSLTHVTGLNAATLYEQAFAQFVPFEGPRELKMDAERREPAALLSPEIRVWVEANRGALEAFRAAVAQDECAWTYDSRDGTLLWALVPHNSAMRDLARVELLEGHMRAEAGDPMAAAGHYLNVAAAGRHLLGGVTMIERLMGGGLRSLSAGALLDLQSDPIAGAQLDYAALAAETRAAFPPPRSAAEVFEGERAAVLDVVQRLWNCEPGSGAVALDPARAEELLEIFASEGTDDPFRRRAFVAQLGEIGFEATVAAVNRVFDDMVRACTKPYPDAQRELAAVTAAFLDDSANPLLRVVIPSGERFLEVATRAEATRRAALVVTQLNAYRQRTGRYPPSLEGIGPDATDPFTGRPFVYQATADGFTLYSVGHNGVDDGGHHDPAASDGDIVYWPRPQPR